MGKIKTVKDLEKLIDRVHVAQKEYADFSEEQVTKIFKAAATAADKARIDLAELAVQETGMGVIEDKVNKNHFAAEYIYNKHKNKRVSIWHPLFTKYASLFLPQRRTPQRRAAGQPCRLDAATAAGHRAPLQNAPSTMRTGPRIHYAMPRASERLSLD